MFELLQTDPESAARRCLGRQTIAHSTGVTVNASRQLPDASCLEQFRGEWGA